MVAKKSGDGSSKDVQQKAEESATLKKEQKETKKAKDENVSESCLNNDAKPTETEVKPTMKAVTQASKTTSKKAIALEPSNKQAGAKETKQSKVDVARKRIRTYLKPRVPSFRKQTSKKKDTKGSVPACRPAMQKKKPPLPKFHSRKKITKTKMRAISPRRRVQKARLHRKPPVPRFAISKRRKGALKSQGKPRSNSSPKQNMTGYQRRNKRKPALPDFSGIRKQKRVKIAKGEQEQSKSKVAEVKQPAKNTNSGDSSVSLKTQAGLQKKTNPESVSTCMPDSLTKTIQSNMNTAISNTSDASRKRVNPSSSKISSEAIPAKPCSKPMNISTGKYVKVQEMKFPKTKLVRERNVNVKTKKFHPKRSGEKVPSKSTSSMSKEAAGKGLSSKTKNKTSKANDESGVRKADVIGKVNTGKENAPAGGGSMQKAPKSGQSVTAM